MKSICRKQNEGPTALKTGLAAFLAAGALMVFHVQLSIIPLAGFVLLCLAAPFFPCIGFYAPVICRGNSGENAVAITFDDGPDPETTPLLLSLLKNRDVKATFFVTGENAAAHPGLIKDILGQGHLIGNHSFGHSTRIFFSSVTTVVKDMEATQRVLNDCGIQALAYRPPVGIITPRLPPALERTGLTLVNFSCRPLDGGNRHLHHLAQRVLKRIQGDDILLLHDRRPPQKNRIPTWLREVEDILVGIEAKGLKVIPLSELIGRPVMKRL